MTDDTKTDDKKDWLTKRLEYIRGLPQPTDVQKLLLDMAAAPALTAADRKQFDALVKAEKAEERAESARIAARAIVKDRSAAERKARDHRMYQAAGLMGLAGLLDSATGELKYKPAALLGAFLGLVKVEEPHRWARWEQEGAALFEEDARKKAEQRKAPKAKATDPGPGPAPVRETEPEQPAG